MIALLLWRSDTADRVRLALDPQPPHRTAHYRDMLVYHFRGDAAVAAGGWRLFGDSLVLGLPASALAVRAANYGIGNDDTVGLAARLPLYGSVARADGIVLAVGINDLEREPVETILARYAALVDVPPDGTRLLCHGVLPIDERVIDADPAGRSNARVAALNAGLRTLCENGGHRYVPPPPGLAGLDGNLRAELHDGDGVHLDADGYAVWIEYLDDVLAPAADTADP